MSLADIFDSIFEKTKQNLDKNYETKNLISSAFKASDLVNLADLKRRRERAKGFISLQALTLLKEKGTKAFQSGKESLALQIYSQYIESAYDIDNSADCELDALLKQGYSNRSTILFRLGLFEQCLQDVNAAIHFDDSSSAADKYLLLDRKAKCLAELNRVEEALVCFQSAVDASVKAPEMLKEAYKSKTTQEMEKLKEVSKNEKIRPERLKSPLAVELGGKLTSIGYFNPKAKVTYAKKSGLGRRAVAKADLAPGEVIAVETPVMAFARCDHKHFVSKVCHHCLSTFVHRMPDKQQQQRRHHHHHAQVVYPSPYVKGVQFCSWDCLNAACENYHRHEAVVLSDYIRQLQSNPPETASEIAGTSGLMFLAFRAVASLERRSIAKVKHVLKERQPDFGVADETVMNWDDTTTSSQVKEENTLRFLCSLLDHENETAEEERLVLAVRSAVLTRILQVSDFFFAEEKLESVLGIAELLYRLQLSIAHNVHSIYRVGGDISGDIPLSNVGSGLYRRSVFLNHSCGVNTTRYFIGGRIVLVARRKISEGEEISNNYGYSHLQHSKDDRRQVLKEDFKFWCQCEACVNDYPDHAELPTETTKKLSKQLERQLDFYQKSFKDGDLIRARKCCEHYLERLHAERVNYPHKNYEIGAIALNSCWWALIADIQ